MIIKLEELSMNAFPALSTVLLNNWVLRFANGYAKRANSVNPLNTCSDSEETTIEACESIYTRLGLDTVFKITECAYGKSIDALLENKNYTYESQTNVLLKNLNTYLETDDSQTVCIQKNFTDDWFSAFAQMNNISEKNAVTLRQMIALTIPETYFASIRENDQIVAVGLGVSQGDYIGMFDIFVHENYRRRGYAERIMNGLMTTAQTNGIQYAYLQVMENNEAAKLLYSKLGYTKQYQYWYRVKPFSAHITADLQMSNVQL